MRLLLLTVLLAASFLQAKAVSDKDLTVQKDYEAKFGNIKAQVLHFGGVSTPKCQFAISNDGQYFYFTKLNSTCKRIINSKGKKIVCNSDKSVCKTREELKEFISNGKNSILDNNANPDLTVSKDYQAKFGNIEAQVLHFGGISTPKCQFAISNDGQYFYFTKLNSTCKRLTNSKGMKIVCNSDKSVCKTRKELREFIVNGKEKIIISKPSWCNANHLNLTEKTICSNKELIGLDKKLASAYGASKADNKDREQINWLKNKRNICGADVECIKSAYRNRISQFGEVNKPNSNSKEENYEKLYSAIEKHDIAAINKILNNSNLNVNYSDSKVYKDMSDSRGTPLYYAIKLGYIDIAKILIKHGADINKYMTIRTNGFYKNEVNKYHFTPLYKAMIDELNVSTLKNIIKLGADINKKTDKEDNYNKTHFHSLMSYSHLNADIVKFFLEHGAKVDSKTSTKATPLMELITSINFMHKKYRNNYIEVVKVLLEHGANPNEKDISVTGRSPIVDVAGTTLDIVKLLRKYGGKLDIISNSGNTMVHKVNDISIAKYIIKNGLKKYVNYKNNEGDTPIVTTMSAFYKDQTKEITKFLFDNGAKIPKRTNLLAKLKLEILDGNYDETYKKSLTDTIYLLDYAKLLLKHGADINQKDKDGKTVLDKVLENNTMDNVKIKVVYFLIKNGAKYKKIHDKNIENYFKSCNSGNLNRLKKVLTDDSYKHIEAEVKGKCKQEDKECVKNFIVSNYGVKGYKIVKKKENKYFVLLMDKEPKLMKLLKTSEGKISLGDK